MVKRSAKERSRLDLVVEMLRGCGAGGATLDEVAAATKLTRDEVREVFTGADAEYRIEDDRSDGWQSVRRLCLSEYERAGLHPNASEVMAWLERGPKPRLYIEEYRPPEMKAALKQLIKRGFVKAIGRGAGGSCYRADRPEHQKRARDLARFCSALIHVAPEEREILGDWV